MRVLLAEDNADHAELTSFVIEEVLPGSTIMLLGNGEALLAQAQVDARLGRLPELIVLDIKMPRMNGYEVLNALKADPALAPLPVLILTTSPDERDRQACLALGASGYLVKPITPAALSACLAKLGFVADEWNRNAP